MLIMMLGANNGWMSHIISYQTNENVPDNEAKAQKIRRLLSRYVIMVDKLYKIGWSTPIFICLAQVRNGICGSHVEGRALTNKLLRTMCYWQKI